MKNKRKLPTVYFDEHIKPKYREDFECFGFKVMLIAKSKFAGTDEHGYLSKLYSRNGIFLTEDYACVKDILNNNNIKHGGIVYFPRVMLDDEKDFFLFYVADFICKLCNQSYLAFRNRILYAAYDGVHHIDRTGKDILQFSWYKTWLKNEEDLRQHLGG